MIIRSVGRRNFEIVPQDGRFDVMCTGFICIRNNIKYPLFIYVQTIAFVLNLYIW